MNRIYTKTGDKGTTGIHGGERVSKTCARIEANGALDELNTAIGIARAHLVTDHKMQPDLREIQMTLMTLMSIVATPDERRCQNVNTIPDNLVENIENLIDKTISECSPSDYFILPGGTVASAFLHQARVVARRAERELWRLNAEDSVPEEILKYINRLSDFFFVLARNEMESNGMDEERWKMFAYKKGAKKGGEK